KHTFTICGIDIDFWKASHDIHHANPNIVGVDTDIETQAIPFLKLYRSNANSFTRYQHLYFPLLYLFTSLWWFSLKDIIAATAEIKKKKSSIVKVTILITRKI